MPTLVKIGPVSIVGSNLFNFFTLSQNHKIVINIFTVNTFLLVLASNFVKNGIYLNFGTKLSQIRNFESRLLIVNSLCKISTLTTSLSVSNFI